MPSPYETVSYPASLDSFVEVADGRNPEQLILARHVNKINGALAAIERHVWYTPTCASATGTGHVVYTQTQVVSLIRGLQPAPQLRIQVPVTVDAALAQQYFGGSPFSRAYGITVGALSWRFAFGTTGGQVNRRYLPVRAAVNTGQELTNLTATIVAVRDDPWVRGDHCEVTLQIIRP